MKTLKFTLAVILGLTASNSFASELNLRMFNNSRFYVVFDGMTYADYTTDFTMYNAAPGNHSIQVVKYKSPAYGYGPMIEVVVYNGSVYLPVNTHVNAMLDYLFRLNITSQYALTPVWTNPAPRCGDDDRHHDNGHHYGRGGTGFNGYYYRNTGNSYGFAMNEYDFNNLKNVVFNASFDATKAEIVKTALVSNYFTSTQVRDLLLLFSFESTKLEIAKLAYAKTIDKEKFFLVYDAFSFSYSVTELNRYISTF